MLVKDYIKKHGNAHFQSVLTKEGKQKISYPNWIITDMRFVNEMKAVKERNGITIKVVRPVHALSQENHCGILHPSETSLDNEQFDYTIVNDSTIEDLVEKVREILINEKLL